LMAAGSILSKILTRNTSVFGLPSKGAWFIRGAYNL
jgi:hypothetical protein